MLRCSGLYFLAACVALLFQTLIPVHAEITETDGPGNIRALRLAGTRLSITTDVWMPAKGWGATARTRESWNVTNVNSSESGDEKIWTGRVSVPGGPAFDYRQTIRESGGKVYWTIRATSRTSMAIEGLYFFLRVPVSVFANGDFRFYSGQSIVRQLVLPDSYPGEPHLSSSPATAIELTDEHEQYRIGVEFDRSRSVTIQDNREWGEAYFAIYYPFHSGNLGIGASASTSLTIDAQGTVETGPVDMMLEPESAGETFDGWGGNFVFCNTDPEVDYLLDELRVAWARSGMSMRDWEPQNDNASADLINWSYFESRVRPGSVLDREFRAAKELEERHIPHIVSIWWLPTWLQPTEATAIPESKWPELMEMVGSYLVFAKNHYGVEPDLFSFNEPDLGVYVLFSPAAHAKAIKVFGQYFESLGLKTKLLLGDTANASNPAYVNAGAADPEVLRYAGAIAFHSWNGSTPDLLAQWKDRARELGIPLLVTEVGSDPSAWHYPSTFWTYGYALDDLENYMQFLTYARPRAALQWEFTCDYPLVDVGTNSVRTSKRYYFVRQLANLTPPQADYIEISTSDPRVWAVAFRGASLPVASASDGNINQEPAATGSIHLVIHIANLGPERTARVSGFPSTVAAVRGVQTTESLESAGMDSFPLVNGTVKVSLAEQSLTTLTAKVQPEASLHFAHFAKGLDLLSSRVSLINPSPDEDVVGRLEVRDDLGQPAETEFDGVQGTEFNDLTAPGQIGFRLPAGGSLNLETTGSGDLVTGSARVLASGPLDGTLRFGGSVGMAGVGNGPVITDGFISPVEYSRSKETNTGVAIAALGRGRTELQFELRDMEGSLQATAVEELEEGGHLAKFVTEFQWNGTAPVDGLVGTLAVRSSHELTATVLQTRPGEFVTLPVTPLLLPTTNPTRLVVPEEETAGGFNLYFPQFAKAEDLLESELILVNPDPVNPAPATFLLLTSLGSPMTVTLNGKQVSGEIEATIPPLGVSIWGTGREGKLAVGSVSVSSARSLGGFVLFSGTVGAAGVGSSPAMRNGFVIPVQRDSLHNLDTGIAILNLEDGAAVFSLELLDESGTPLARSGGQIPPKGQTARYVTQYEWDKSVDLSDFSGLLRVCSAQRLAATALLSLPGQFATLPVTRLDSTVCNSTQK